MEPVTTLEIVLRRDRAVVTAGLVGVAALGWVYLLYLARGMAGMDMSADTAMPRMQTWGVVDVALLFVMWAVMMVAMMVPSASPLILIMAATNRKRRERDDPLVPTGLFLAGYLLVWAAFSAVANRRPMGAAREGAALTRYGQRQSGAGRSAASDRRDLSVHLAQAGLSYPLPVAAGVCHGTLA